MPWTEDDLPVTRVYFISTSEDCFPVTVPKVTAISKTSANIAPSSDIRCRQMSSNVILDPVLQLVTSIYFCKVRITQ